MWGGKFVPVLQTYVRKVQDAPDEMRATVDQLYREQSRRIFATLIRVLGDFELAEESVQEAFTAAVQQWSREGLPSNPSAWLVSTGRFKAIDAMRRRARFDKSLAELASAFDESAPEQDFDEAQFRDDHLRLIFTCCHPILPPESRIALTLRETCGLTTEEIARAFLTSPATIAQRIVRGKAKIREAKIPFEVPSPTDIPERLDSVLAVIYLVFNEGYSATSGESATRPDVSGEAIRLCRVLLELLPDVEVQGLLALMLLHESRRKARTDAQGDLILLEDQDRSLWNRVLIAEGLRLVSAALSSNHEIGPYAIQAAISAVHASASTPEETDWAQIVAYYDLLLQAGESPVVELNRAVAVAMRDGAESGVQLIDAILARGELSQYHLLYAAKADLCRRIGKVAEARRAYESALRLVKQEPERRFLAKRLNELG